MNGNKSGKPGRSSGGTGGGPWADPADPRSQRHARIVVAAMRALDVRRRGGGQGRISGRSWTKTSSIPTRCSGWDWWRAA